MAEIYTQGNAWQKKVYQRMSEFLEKKCGVTNFGSSKRGNEYKHLLTTSEAHLNFITKEIYLATKDRIEKHKLGDSERLLTNTAASQSYCFNLVVYLNQNLDLASQLFSNLFGKKINVIHIEPEFTPNKCEVSGFEKTFSDESLGDQNESLGIGTDADIAIFYTYEKNRKGVLLIEFKFIEAEFSVCSSFKNKNDIRKICQSKSYFEELVLNKKADLKNKYLCGYNKYENWTLTEKSTVLDISKIKNMNTCPFKDGENQLWRNFLLAEKVSQSRKCEEFGFWVFSPKENDKYLWENGDIETKFRNILTSKGKNCFKKVYLNSVLDELEKIVQTSEEKNWLYKMKQKYDIK